ncbi:DNA polymerase IV [Patescibacteria group bacterium]
MTPLNVSSWPRAVVHLDGDAFFASCEQAMHPEWRGRPVVTGKERNIVAAASYEAKALGIKRGVPLWEVRKICPDTVIVPSDYESYSLFSKRMFEIMRRFTPEVEEYSIDEGFADITGMRRPLRMSYENIARKMKESVEADLGITVSVGLSLTKVLAKIASDHDKPSGLTSVPGRRINEFLRDLDIEEVWGIGPRTGEWCRKLRIRTALDFALKPEQFIRDKFTKPHQEIWRELRGEQVYEVETAERSSYVTISKTKTFTPASSDRPYVYAQLVKNLENACIKARRHQLVTKGLCAYLRRQDYRCHAMEATLTRATAYPVELAPVLQRLFDAVWQGRTEYRATGIVLTSLVPDTDIQMSLFERQPGLDKMRQVYDAVDRLADKYGKHAVVTAGSLAAHRAPQHSRDRGDVTLRKQNRLPGETARRHLKMPVLLGEVK